jgi:anti-sigma-K factor RskA
MSERFSRTPSHDEFRDDLAAYALGALEEPEAARLEAHLEGCDECRRHLRWLEPAVDVLPRTVEQREPPEQLRERLMDTVRAEAPPVGPDPSRSQAAGWWRRLGTSMWRPATAVAATAMLIVGVVAGYLIAEPGGGGSTTTFEAQAMPNAPNASGSLARNGGAGILRVRGMPTLASDQVYEVWVQHGDRLDPSSLFVPRSNHTAEAAVPRGLDGADAILVTREPRGGTKKPTSSPLLSVQLN